MLDHLTAGDAPAIHLEHKLLYPLEMLEQRDLIGATLERTNGVQTLPTMALRYAARFDCVATVVAYGYQAELARRVIARLALEEEIFVELLVPGQIAPLDCETIAASTEATGSLLTVEEGTAGWSWGTEIAARIGARLFGALRRPVAVLASEPDVIPSAREREREMLVGDKQIEAAIRLAAA
jgi:pyruvate/2-oxoglutarate/acetoin dehydrogenase E1 component